jgi:hypothetical protein
MASSRRSTLALAVLASAWIMAARTATAQGGRPALAAFRTQVEAADAALQAGQPARARERIDAAQAMLPAGRRRAEAALDAARAAIDRGAAQEARAALQPLLARLSAARGRGG